MHASKRGQAGGIVQLGSEGPGKARNCSFRQWGPRAALARLRVVQTRGQRHNVCCTLCGRQPVFRYTVVNSLHKAVVIASFVLVGAISK